MKTLLALMLLLASSAVADQVFEFASVTTTRGKSYKMVKVTRHDATEIRFTHADGVATVDLAELPKDIQDVFGYDPVAASFLQINKQEERKRQIIEDADKKAKNAVVAEQQAKESKAISAIEKSGVRLSLAVQEVEGDQAKCKAWGIGFKQLDGSGKTPAKKTMSGDYETVEILTYLPVPGEENSFVLGLPVIVHGINHEAIGKQLVMIVYPVGAAKKGETQHYATDCSTAYRLLKDQEKAN